MAFPTTRLRFNFNQPDGALPSGLVAPAEIGAAAATVANGRMVGGDGYQGAVTDAVFADSEVYVTLADADDGNLFFGLLMRWDEATGNGYGVNYITGSDAEIRLVRYDATVPTTLGSVQWIPSDGDGLGARVVGGSFVVWVRDGGVWQLAGINETDPAPHSSGAIGLHMFDTGGPSLAFDDLGGGTVGVPGAAPTLTISPRTDGIAETGVTMTCDPGAWAGDPTIAFDYQWQRDGVDISTAEADSYELEAEDENSKLRCRVTAWNASGIAVAYTPVIEPIASTAGMDDTLVAVDGLWVPTRMHVAVNGEWF